MVVQNYGLMHFDNQNEETFGDFTDKVDEFVKAMACVMRVSFIHYVTKIFILIFVDHSFKGFSGVLGRGSCSWALGSIKDLRDKITNG